MDVADPLEKRELATRRRTSMSEVKNTALARRLMEARVKGDLDALDAMLAPDFVNHNKLVPGQEPDRENFKRAVSVYHAALGERHLIIEDQIAAADKVVTRFTIRATHDRGELLGVAPSGREMTILAIVIHRISGGKIAEEWSMGTEVLWKARAEQELRKRERVEEEMRVARSIQQAALPREVPHLEGWQISPYYQPAREVGGDFYEFFELDDGRVGFAVGDATGKGVPAAFVMSATCALLGGVATASGSSPGEVLARVNEAMLTRIPPSMFVTCFYAILEPESGRLSYANAGHDLPYLWHSGECEELRARGMPLGLMPGMGYEEKETVLQGGDSALLYTDGLVEAHDPKGEMFGFPRLQALVSELAEEESSLGEALLEELYSFVGEGWEQEDDITLLTLRCTASPS